MFILAFFSQEPSWILCFLLKVLLCFFAIYHCPKYSNNSDWIVSPQDKYFCENHSLVFFTARDIALISLVLCQMNIRRPECHYGFGASHRKQHDEETKRSLINPRDSITSACLSLLHFSGIILHYISAAWYVLRSRYACLNTDVVEMYRRRLFCKRKLTNVCNYFSSIASFYMIWWDFV